MSTITPTAQITLTFSCKDRAATARWFQDHLGFRTAVSNDAVGWTELSTNTPGVTLGFGDADTPNPGNCVPVFSVADVDGARAALEAKDVRFDGDTQTIEGMVKLATFYDPDGNAFMLAEDLSGSA